MRNWSKIKTGKRRYEAVRMRGNINKRLHRIMPHRLREMKGQKRSDKEEKHFPGALGARGRLAWLQVSC